MLTTNLTITTAAAATIIIAVITITVIITNKQTKKKKLKIKNEKMQKNIYIANSSAFDNSVDNVLLLVDFLVETVFAGYI